ELPTLDAALINSVHELDWSLGLRHHAMLVSPIFSCESYLIFVHHVLARAARFATDYNAALAEYRHENGIKSPGRPMPDMAISNDRCEVPFWLDSLAAAKRVRPSVVSIGGKWALRTEAGATFIFEESLDAHAAADAFSKWLVANELRISPRALMLTI